MVKRIKEAKMGLKEDIEEYMSEPYDKVVKEVESAPDAAAYKRNLWNSIFRQRLILSPWIAQAEEMLVFVFQDKVLFRR